LYGCPEYRAMDTQALRGSREIPVRLEVA
jgi:hypothetical protein